jgi:hypothetical protein
MLLNRGFWWFLLGGGLLLGGYGGCGQESPDVVPLGAGGAGVAGVSSGGSSLAGTSAAGAGAGASGTASGAGGSTSAGSAGSSSGTFPVIGPDWIPYKPKNSPCTYYFMPTGGTPPPPIEWGPCVDTGIQDVACLQRTPTTPDSPLEGGIFWDRWANPPHLVITRVSVQGFEVDFWRPQDDSFAGAIANAEGGGFKSCSLNLVRPPNDGTYVLDRLEPVDASKSLVIAGQVGSIPSLEFATGDSYTVDDEDYFGTKNWIITLGDKLYASPWNSEDRQVIYSPSTHSSGLPALPEFGHEDAFFLNPSASGKTGWVAWVAGKGVQDLLIQPVTYQRGFPSLGTDGVDMVVTYGENATAEYEYKKRTLLHFKYTTDPEELVATSKPVANIPPHSAADRWAVGCGYAAIGAADDESGVSLFVVRLSDGMTWRKFPFNPMAFGGIRPKAITCKEIFLSAGSKGYVQRIALDSLGEGVLAPPQVSEWPF